MAIFFVDEEENGEEAKSTGRRKVTTPGTTARKRTSGASLYTTLARFVCLRKSCFRRVGRMTEEDARAILLLAGERDRGEGEKLRSKWSGEGYGWINTITGVARSRHSQPNSRGETRERREMGEMGEI